MREFQMLLQSFFVDYLPRQRGFGENTLTSYRDAFVLLLRWIQNVEGMRLEKLLMADLDTGRLGRFVEWLRNSRGCCPSTCKARMSAIRSFARFALSSAPEHAGTCKKILEMPVARPPASQEIEYMGIEGIKALVEAASEDLRILAVVSMLYDSAARVSELCTMTVGDLSVGRPCSVRIIGKGGKARVVPLSEQVGTIMSRYLEKERLDCAPREPLFVNRGGKSLSRAGITYILTKCIRKAHASRPDVAPPRTHPHAIRHSKSMHLLEAGVNLVYIRDFLGHESVTTTEIYARANTEMKRKAIESVEANVIPESPYDENERAELMEWLRNLL
jgi:site-specific recombinase XerD